MEEEEAGFVVNKPWDNVSSCPYRDDPLPKLDATTDAGRGSNTREVEGFSRGGGGGFRSSEDHTNMHLWKLPNNEKP